MFKIKMPIIGEVIYVPPMPFIDPSPPGRHWTVISVHPAAPYEEKWGPEFQNFFNNIGLGSLPPIQDEVIGKMKCLETGKESDLTDLFYQFYRVKKIDSK